MVIVGTLKFGVRWTVPNMSCSPGSAAVPAVQGACPTTRLGRRRTSGQAGPEDHEGV